MSIEAEQVQEALVGLYRMMERGEAVLVDYMPVLDDLATGMDRPEAMQAALAKHGHSAYRAIGLAINHTRAWLAARDNERWLASQEDAHGTQ